MCVVIRLSEACHTLSQISVAAPAVSSSFTISEWPKIAAACSAVCPFCGQCTVEQLIHLSITLGVMQVQIPSDQDMYCILSCNDDFNSVVVIFRLCSHVVYILHTLSSGE